MRGAGVQRAEHARERRDRRRDGRGDAREVVRASVRVGPEEGEGILRGGAELGARGGVFGLQRFDGGRRVDVAHGHVARGGRRERGGFPRASGGGGHAVRLIRGCCLVTRIR